MMGFSLYFMMLSRETSTVPIENSANLADPIREEEMRGKQVNVNTYDLNGNLISSGKSESVLLVGDSQLSLEDGLEYQFNRDGKKYFTRADSFVNLPDGTRKLSAEPGRKILLAIENGISIETDDPLLYGPDEVIRTEGPATFKMGQIEGRCIGLQYKAGSHLELLSKAIFTSHNPEGSTSIQADFLRLDYKTLRGEIRRGVVQNRPKNSDHSNKLEAARFDIAFRGDPNKELLLDNADLYGSPTRIEWEQGHLSSPQLNVHFDKSGKTIARVTSGTEAVYTSLSSGGSQMEGKTGKLSFTFSNGTPQNLKSATPILLTVLQEGRPPLVLTGQKGLESQFSQGRVRSTQLFGTPAFSFGPQSGKAGTLRVLHDERKVLLGQTAELADSSQNLLVKGDEILLAQWDQDQQEIFANRFVEVIYASGTPDVLRSWGETLTLKLPSQHAVLTGSPARLEQNLQNVEAHRIEIRQIGPQLYELKNDDEVNLTLQTDQGPFNIVAKGMFFSQEKQMVTFQEVQRAVMADQGSLSANFLEIFMPQTAAGRHIQRIEAKGSVLYEGLLKDEDTSKPFSARSDKLEYDAKNNTIVFSGNQKDVEVTHPEGQLKGRKLTYNLITGSMRVDSATHGATQTTVKINDQQKNNLR